MPSKSTAPSGILTLDRLNAIIKEESDNDNENQINLSSSLDSFHRIDNDVAKRLIKINEYLFLDGIVELSVEIASILSKHRGDLFLRGLREISPGALEVLAKHRGTRLIIRIKSLSESQSEALGKYKGDELVLCDLKKLTAAAARNLSKCKCDLTFEDLTTLTTSVAEALSQHRGTDCDSVLGFSSLESLSAPAAMWLARYKGRLYMPELEKLEKGALEALAAIDPDRFWNIKKSVALELYRCRAIGKTLYPAIELLRQRGFTFLNSVFEGWGDDGTYCHYVSKEESLFCQVQDGSDSGLNDSLSKEIEYLLRTEGMADKDGILVDGISCGMVGIFLLNLKTGKAIWTCGDGHEPGRIAELIAICEIDGLSEVSGQFDLVKQFIETDELCGDIFGFDTPDLVELALSPSFPLKALQRLKSIVGVGFAAMREMDGACNEESWLAKIWSAFSEYVVDRIESCKNLTQEDVVGRIRGINFVVNPTERTIVYTKGSKRLTIKIPKGTIKTRRFKLALDAELVESKASKRSVGSKGAK
jgi:hypothetical protein